MFKRIRRPEEVGTRQGGRVASCSASESFPNLWAFFTDTEWDDGTEREPGTVLICEGGGRVRLWLNNKAEGLAAWVSGSTWTEAMVAAEEGLGDGSLEWRAAKPPLGPGRGGKR